MTNDKKQQDDVKSFGHIVSDAFKELGETLTAFVKAPKALWGINVPYILEGLAYFGILTILGKFASENINLSDLHAGWLYAGVTGGITFAMLLLGGIVDKIGVRLALIFSLACMALARVVISLGGTLQLGNGLSSPMFYTICAGLALMVAAYGLYQPAAYAGVKRYTNPQTAAMGYAVLYALMNLGAFFSGYIANFTRKAAEPLFQPNGLTAVFWAFSAISIISVLVSAIILTKRTDHAAVVRVTRESEEMKQLGAMNAEKLEAPSKSKQKINNARLILFGALAIVSLVCLIYVKINRYDLAFIVATILLSISLLALTTWEFIRHRPEHPFRDVRFMFFIFVLIPVQTLFAHNWLTIPYYLDRAFRGNWVGNYWEIFANINPIVIFIITPIIAGLTARANVYRMMILGTFVMALPTFLLAVGPNPWLFILYILIMSVGEAMWQPRFLQWVAEIAPEGQTGAYMGIGQFPWFLTKVITGLYSGYFVANFIPQTELGLTQRTGEMWLIYAIIAMLSPLGLWLAKNWMVKGMKEKA